MTISCLQLQNIEFHVHTRISFISLSACQIKSIQCKATNEEAKSVYVEHFPISVFAILLLKQSIRESHILLIVKLKTYLAAAGEREREE